MAISKTRLSLFIAPLAALALSACSNDPLIEERDPSAEQSPEPVTAPVPVAAKPGIIVANATLVLPAVKGNPAAVYFDLKNTGSTDVTLASASVTGAKSTELHETNGSAMNKLNEVPLAPSQAVAFEQGGKHGMAFDIDPTWTDGSTTEITLTFADGDKISVPLTVKAAAAQ